MENDVEEVVVEESPVIEVNVDTDDIVNKLLETLDDTLQPVEEILPSVTDTFITDNQELIVNTLQLINDNQELAVQSLQLINWWGFVGIPLVIIVALFYGVYREFLYTKI